MKFFLSAVFVLAAACLSLHAKEGVTSVVYYDNVAVAGKEYMFDQSDSSKQQNSIRNCRKAPGIKEETTATDENGITERGRESIVLPAFPFLPSTLVFSRDGRESATIPPHRRQDKPLPPVKTCRANTCSDIAGSNQSFYLPEQRQKLSPAATQFGMLTSFGSNYPPLQERRSIPIIIINNNDLKFYIR